MVKVRRILKASLTTAAGAYTVGFQVGALITLTGAIEVSGETTLLRSIALVDGAKQKIAGTLFFFSLKPTDGGDKASLALTAAEMQAKCIGKVDIPATAYSDTANSSIATVANIQLELKGEEKPSGTYIGNNIYAIFMTSGTPTYGAGTFIQLRIGVES